LPETVFQRDGVEHQALQLLLHFPQFQQAKSSPPVFQQDGDRLALKSNGKTIAWVKAELFPYWWLFKNLRSTGINKRSVMEGYQLDLELATAISGILALGYGAHFGLGLLQPRRGTVAVSSADRQDALAD